MRVLAFLAGLGAVTAGTALSESSLAAHMLGHGLIVAVGAPLIVLCRPVGFLLRTLPRPAARDLAGLLRHPLARTLLWPPLALAAFAAVQLAFHLTPLFDAALGDGPLHELEHALFFWTALWLWTVGLAVEPLPRRWPPFARAALLLAAMPISDAGAIRLMLDGDAAAGGAMVVAMMPFGLAAATIAWRGLLREERRQASQAPSQLSPPRGKKCDRHKGPHPPPPTRSHLLPRRGKKCDRRARGRGVATMLAALVLAAFAAGALARPPSEPAPRPSDFLPPGGGSKSEASPSLVEEGQGLFEEGCSSCHGFDGDGVEGRGPSLAGAGEAAADFYLRTGRMPLNQVGDEPLRAPPHYPEDEIRALVAYVGSLGPGPAIPTVDPERGSLSEGFRLFQESCAGCHGTSGKGGVAIGGYAPPLGAATPTQVGEAIRVGPYLMPRFSAAQLSDEEVDSIARYVELTKEPDDAGGWGIGHIGPVPEGLIAWLAAIAAILLVARLIGERERNEEPR